MAITTPSFIVFGHMSDRVGRKKSMLAGCGLAAPTYVPMRTSMKRFGNPGGLPVGGLFIRETKDHRIDVELHA